jgi:hypothetical protein
VPQIRAVATAGRTRRARYKIPYPRKPLILLNKTLIVVRRLVCRRYKIS